MYNRLLKGLTILILFSLTSFVSAQGVTLQIIPDPRLDHSQIIYLSDFDFLEEGDIAEKLFTILIISDQTYKNSIMRVELIKGMDLLAFLETKPFDLPAGTNDVTNLDFSQGSFRLDNGTEVYIRDSGIADNLVDDLSKELYSSGKLPVGSYHLKVKMRSQSFPGPVETEHPFIITNPTMISLVSPGSEIGLGPPQEIFTQFPVFQWNGNSGEYQVVVFEKKNEFESLDDVLNSFPNWESERISDLSVQYPNVSTGNNPVLPLEFGNTYYWLVKAFVQTSSGENEILSEIWQFSVVDPTKMIQTADDLAIEDLQRLLRDLLGTQQAEEIAKNVSDFHLKSIRINGRPITVQELYQIIDQYRGQDLQILDLIMQQSN